MAAETILIIEDDPTLRVLKDNFTSGGFAVRSASDGEQGLHEAVDRQPDLIVLDIMLPKINGYELCRLIRKERLDIPTIVLTAMGQESDIVLVLDLGVDDYVAKPFSVKEQLARANAFLRRRRERGACLYRFGECELNTVSRKVFRNGNEIALTPKEFSLLVFFARHAWRALARDEILRSVWGGSIWVTARSVDRCVTTLRN
jgi:DNA-binding response OmpR family regulator